MNKIVYLAVDSQGDEYVFDFPPHRGKQYISPYQDIQQLVNDQEEADYWYPRVIYVDNTNYVHYYDEMILPKGSIFKLTGRNITWDDGYIMYTNE